MPSREAAFRFLGAGKRDSFNMTNTTTTIKHPDDINFLTEEVQECPYPSYQLLLEEAPVWKDPVTGFYVVTRYQDLREILKNPTQFGNDWQKQKTVDLHQDRVAKIRKIFEDKGWVPAPTLAGRDGIDHKPYRKLFEKAFRAGKIKLLDPFIEETAYRLFDEFVDDGHCDWVKQFAIPFPLIVICAQMGIPKEDIWRIKAWTDAWIQRFGMMQPEEDEMWSVEMEIEAQHYFQSVFERLRKQPDDTVLSDLINTVIPEWDRTLNDNELHGLMMADTFVGGSETTTNAIAAGVMLLIQNPESWQRVKTDPDKYLRTFIEEVLRLEAPVQGLYRIARTDIELHGVTIPEGAVLNIRFAAANRDKQRFGCPDQLDLDRKNAASHLTFGSGIHHCLGAPLARRELYWSFKALIDRINEMWFAEGKNDFKHHPNFALRALKELHIEFNKKR